MKAVLQNSFGGPEVLFVGEVERPAPLPTEVLVRVYAAGVNPVDWKTRGGTGMARVLGEPPFILGWDVAGVVEEIGYGVTTVAPGDRVFGMPWFPRSAGAYAEYVTAPARQFVRMPQGLTFEQAAGVPLAALTAWQVLGDTARIEPGQRVLITAAAGGVGHLAVQFAKHLGAYVIAVAGPGNQEWVAGLGADEVVDYTTKPLDEQVSNIDVAVELVGDNLPVLRTVRRGGLLVPVPSGVDAEAAEAAKLAGVRVAPFLVEPDGAALSTIAGLIDSGAVAVEIARVLPLEQAAEAHRQGEKGHTRGKIVLRVRGEQA
ncbi:NADPH:quinone reductase [Actinoplanes cyaneus]|uniref:NADPH:quinone reductase n=2 Tax=Actinoplanes cyaneus TaxID=52696 RepID=A0A919M472_9ACTN|nr:NADPH:quinone reductase [Actinoplanes cyaneus]GID65287.1 NADPH:quinone reductase [Actinoplanes cyaneus]